MRICFIGPANSAHIQKWCAWFIKQGHEVHVISFTKGTAEGAVIHLIDLGVDTDGGDASKLKYLTAGGRIKREVESIRPDVISVHYATSYGIAVALSGIKNYTLSVWGSDIFEFPRKSPLHKALLKASLWRASHLMSTSRAMADEASLYTKKHFDITPFGVDTNLFNPDKRTRTEKDTFVVGTVKGLSDTYGIRNILEAVAMIHRDNSLPVRLRIAGKGPQEDEYHKLARELGISDITDWLGFISQEEAAMEWANMDLALIPSIAESFGVAAVEAQACETPVVISSIPGLMETTLPGTTSVTVNSNSSHELKSAIEKLYSNPDRLESMGVNGRRFVLEHYELNKCFTNIEKLLIEYRVKR